jgi:hypothetical protein
MPCPPAAILGHENMETLFSVGARIPRIRMAGIRYALIFVSAFFRERLCKVEAKSRGGFPPVWILLILFILLKAPCCPGNSEVESRNCAFCAVIAPLVSLRISET